MIWQFGELGYDYSIEENGRTGKKPIKWEYYNDTDRKGLYNTYAKLMVLRNANSDLFDTSTSFSWQVKGNTNWQNGRFITLHTIGKNAVVAGNFTDISGNYNVTFPHTGTWYNYVAGETVEITSTTQSIVVPAHDFKLFLDFQTAY